MGRLLEISDLHVGFRTEDGVVQAVRGVDLSIGQGENTQTILNMARFYTALATDGSAARPEVVAHLQAHIDRLKGDGPCLVRRLRPQG